MNSNPYSTILDLTKNEESSSDIMIGEVISANPIVVQIGELQIDKDDILIADYLYTDTLELSDRLAILRTADKQTYIIVARLREV